MEAAQRARASDPAPPQGRLDDMCTQQAQGRPHHSVVPGGRFGCRAAPAGLSGSACSAPDHGDVQMRVKAKRDFADQRARAEARQQAEMDAEQRRRARYGESGHHARFADGAGFMNGASCEQPLPTHILRHRACACHSGIVINEGGSCLPACHSCVGPPRRTRMQLSQPRPSDVHSILLSWCRQSHLRSQTQALGPCRQPGAEGRAGLLRTAGP